MSRKHDLLFKEVYHNFITGVYGPPRIPSDKDVWDKVESITPETGDIPIMKNEAMDDIYYDKIYKRFSDMIDDINVLYKSVDSQSLDILDQLTNSLKEHLGTKRELKLIEQRAEDIQAGKLGKDYLKYIHTENFNDLTNVNVDMTTIDPDTSLPTIDTKSGTMYIANSTMNLVDLTHYYQRKLEMINSNYIGTIVEAGYIGNSDASSLLDFTDDRRLIYRIKTGTPTELKTSFVLQLNPQRKEEEINGVALLLDSAVTAGWIRLQYKTVDGWNDFGEVPQTEIKADKLKFSFSPVTTSHLKFQFIKFKPDILDSNEYFLSLQHISVFKKSTYKSSSMYSKSIKMEPYEFEKPVIGNIAVEGQGMIPDGCSIDIFVAKDKRITGFFTNNENEYVLPQSVHATTFVDDAAYLYPDRHVLLSDIKGKFNISGIAPYQSQLYDWKSIASFNNNDSFKPSIIDFVGVNQKDPFNNSIHSISPILFGDVQYVNNSGVYPQDNYTQILDQWFMSGVVNDSNPYWEVGYPSMSGLVASGILQIGMDFGTNISGFPFNYYDNSNERTIRFDDHHTMIPGWWRPSAETVHPSGLSSDVYIEDPIPDFFFNGMRFYRIYKFEPNSEVVESTIKLYTYQTKPMPGNGNDYYPHNMVWKYNSKDIIGNVEYATNQKNPVTGADAVGPPSSGLIKIPLDDGQDLIFNSIQGVKYVGHNVTLDQDIHWKQTSLSGYLWVDMSPVVDTERFLEEADVYMRYSYRMEDKYTSYWEGFLLATDDSEIIVKQKYIPDSGYGLLDIVDRVLIQTIDGSIIHDDKLTQTSIVIPIPKGSYRISIFCLTDPFTKFCAGNWTPYSSDYIEVGGSLRIVSRIDPVKIVDFDILLHTTPYENDNRASIITGSDSLKYIVVKEPSKAIVPGYYYDNQKKSYLSDSTSYIKNIGHYKRDQLFNTGFDVITETFITGSRGSVIMSGNVAFPDQYTQDITWNDGSIFPADEDNTDTTKTYAQHSTFGNSINVEDNHENLGHLFYNTAENLPAFYTIEYGLIDRYDPTVNRFLYKVQLISEHENNTPILDSLKFTMNVEEESFK